MTNLILPPGLTLPKQILPLHKPSEETTDEKKGTMLPKPSGYKLLCVVPDVSTKLADTTLDLERPSAQIRQEEHSTTVLFVIDVGPDAYKDKAKFPGGAWCKKGDFVIVRAYAGTRFKIYSKEFRLINDDQIEAVVSDPRGISRA
jgi:co-chaperonin GroES (HSP10)